ncbi:MAG TPA: saccharopine dehydrogenase NADP-binding domain-containing protein [Candidatus Enterocloster faecavium]|uniref:shikimate dehydrogenase (NADP(+)) n=1 Tax=Candidatus Enterocloster faecavium TaxID=2838560 RepID=A0A9D2L5A1_9FIRM|nr:saccharopine dehydrogenase NADP-binding domain-containing protein [Candidatus Enterocloster faecavium]
MRVKFDINTKYSCQIGYPLDYSCAAYVHNRMYEIANLNAICLAIELKPEDLPAFIEGNRVMGMSGFDITTPFKSEIIKYLDECEESSRVFKCVNHVKWVDGKLVGVGLDGVGMGMAIARSGAKIEGSRVTILGAGAVAGPIAADLCKRGASSVCVINRTKEKAEYIAEQLKLLYPVKTYSLEMTKENLEKMAQKTDLLVQCTTLGAAGHKNDYKDLGFVDKLPDTAVVADVLYPHTSLLDKAAARGLKTVNGMGMLACQQIAMMKFRFDVDMPDSALKEAEEAVCIAVAMRDLRLAQKK